MGYARSLASGSWAAFYREPVADASGRRRCARVPKSPDYPTKATAKAAGDAYEHHLRSLAKGLGAKVASRRRTLTLDAYAPGAIAQAPDLADSTRTTYRSAVRSAVREHFGVSFEVEWLTADAVERYYSSIGHLAAKTRQTRIIALAAVARRAIRDGALAAEHHPAHWGITVHEDQPVRRRVLSDAELDRLAAAMPPHLWAAPIIGHDTGLRVSELAALSLTDIEWGDDGRAYLWITRTTNTNGSALHPHVKNKVIRRVPLSVRALGAWMYHVRNFVPDGEQRLFWKGRPGKRSFAPAGTQYFDIAMRRAREIAQIERIAETGNKPFVGWHDLRRAFATKIYRATRDVREVQHLMGHATVAMTMKYILDFEREEERREAVDMAFGVQAATPPQHLLPRVGGRAAGVRSSMWAISESAA